MAYIAEKILPGSSIEPKCGTLTTPEGENIHVSAYAESAKAMISTPGVDRSKNSIYESGHECLMYRQTKDGRAIIYRVSPEKIDVAEGSTSADWETIRKAASKYWICKDETIKEMGGT